MPPWPKLVLPAASSVTRKLANANWNLPIGHERALEFVVGAEENEVLVVVCILNVGVLEDKAIIEPKRDGICEVMANSKGCPETMRLFRPFARGFVVLVE